jgi:hypothetical protein
VPAVSPVSFDRLGAEPGQALWQIASPLPQAIMPLFLLPLSKNLKFLAESDEDESFGLLEVQIRIWKCGLDSEAGIDLLKNPEPFGVPRVRLN